MKLKSNNFIVKKADKGTTTVIVNKQDKIREGQILVDEKKNSTRFHHLWN